MGKIGLPTGFAQILHFFGLAGPGMGWPQNMNSSKNRVWNTEGLGGREIPHCAGRHVRRSERENKKSACSVRNDGVGCGSGG